MAIKIGEYIGKDISFYISQWTETKEYNDIARDYNQSDELARKIVRRDRKITDNNLPMFMEILKLAIKNRTHRHKRLLDAHKEAKEIVKTN